MDVDVQARLAEIHAVVTHNTHQLDKVTVLLTGNGEPEKGIVMRLHDLERSHKWLYGILAAICAPSTIGGIVWYLFL